MLTNRQLDHSFPAVLDILRKGLNLHAPLDIPPDEGLCPWTPLGALPPDPRYRLVLCTRHSAPTPSAAYDPRALSRPLILTSLRLWRDSSNSFDTIPACDGQTDKRMDTYTHRQHTPR